MSGLSLLRRVMVGSRSLSGEGDCWDIWLLERLAERFGGFDSMRILLLILGHQHAMR